ncbi:MAG: nucleotide pyrophosphohydrolase [Isosphaeraceae bacterium]
MTDQETTIAQLKALVLRFSKERDWEQFHHPKDLALALACEVGEVLEHLRFRTNDEVRASLNDPDQRRAFAHELADCLWALVRLADVSGIDLAASLQEKVELAALKYPVDQAYGRADKYTSYQGPTARDRV